MRLDRGDELVVGFGRADDLDVVDAGEQGDGALANQVVVLREDHAQHARMVHGHPPTGRRTA